MKRLTLSALFVFVTAFSLDASPHWLNTVDHIGSYVSKPPVAQTSKKEPSKKRARRRSAGKQKPSVEADSKPQSPREKPPETASNSGKTASSTSEQPSVSRWKAWTAAALTAVGALTLGRLAVRQAKRVGFIRRLATTTGDVGRLTKLLLQSFWARALTRVRSKVSHSDDLIAVAASLRPPLYAIQLQAQIPHIVNEFSRLFNRGDVFALRLRTTPHFMQAWEPALVAGIHLLHTEDVHGAGALMAVDRTLPSKCASATESVGGCHLETEVLPIHPKPTDPKSVRVRITGWGRRGKEHVQIFDEVWHFTENQNTGDGSPRWLLNDVDPLTTAPDTFDSHSQVHNTASFG